MKCKQWSAYYLREQTLLWIVGLRDASRPFGVGLCKCSVKYEEVLLQSTVKNAVSLFAVFSFQFSEIMSANDNSTAAPQPTAEVLFDPVDYPIGAMIIIFSAFVGVVINGYVFFAVRKAKTFGYAFGQICISHTVANFGNCFVFGFLIAPILILNPEFHRTYWGARCGQFLIMVYNASLFSHLLTAINRFCVVYFPLKYNILFDEKTTKFTIFVVWFCAVLQVLPYFSPDCTLYFDGHKLEMLPMPTTCSIFVVVYMCYYLSVGVIGLFGVLDVATFIGIHFHNKNRVTTGSSTSKLKRSREIRFFFQACVQDIAFLSELILYFSIAPYFTAYKWMHFTLTTVIWISLHTADGLIVIIFNKEMRTMITSSPAPTNIYNSSGAPNARERREM
ncbi:hypothetical protein L596_012529 [Steinernema carpocapsae]|uniref:7TM GPCR serpentine receptor class x (Srx) domain-containing protein n=1 Tax=Steinernema carpocapsae TaxID=34508 RepID=A0A4U5NXJ8_STECR|nr:hypothetical protein L596_012529 [Steinernema carpocapsae]